MRFLLFMTALLALTLNACVYDHAHIDLAKYRVYQGEPEGRNYEALGAVDGSAKSWVFAACKDLATEAVKQMLDQAKQVGANAVYNVRFHAGDRPQPQPTCKRYLGMLVILTPWPATAGVSGDAVRTNDDKRRADAILLPSGESTQHAADAYVASRVGGDN